jgi:hypothetical protein
VDFEGAIADIEKNLDTHQFVEMNDTLSASVVADDVSDTSTPLHAVDLKNHSVDLKNHSVDLKNYSVDLKNLIKQEFSISESSQ